MPPSPSLRFSPGRERGIEHHRRGRSLESGLPLKEKDEDLALFNDMQTRERDTFLLHPADDFDVSLSTKLRYFSDYKLGISIPVRGESSDLLNADAEKNDYDWLLTPPDTPLFPSLDDETPPVNLAQRGRPRSQPIAISRSFTAEKSCTTSRSSASPHRMSPSPRSKTSTLQSRGRPSSAPNSSPAPVLRSTTPSRRPSTPPSKPSTPIPRSSTPTQRRMSTGSSGGSPSTSGRRGASPVKANRGNSASPKLRSWHSNLPGFSSDPPPNLRTSLSDRPASHVRGLSPASRNGKETPLRLRRQSMSPTASRSASSSHSHDRDQFSSQSKGSVVSSHDDDMDSLQSVTAGISKRSETSNGSFPSSRAVVFSKKPSRTLSSSSAAKRSFDSTVRQMDQRKTPQNMFRPLLSSVPASTFYVGKANSTHRPMISRNSSVTTSSNASSDQCASAAPDTEGSDLQDDLANDWVKTVYPNSQEEVFMFDKVDEIDKDMGNEILEGKPSNGHENFDRSTASQVEQRESESSHTAGIPSEVDSYQMVASCSKCGVNFLIMAMDESVDICRDCLEKGCIQLAAANPAQKNTIHSEMALEESRLYDELGPEIGLGIPKFPEKITTQPMFGQLGMNVEQGHGCSPDSCLVQVMVEEGEERLVENQLVGQQSAGSSQSNINNTDQQLQHLNAHPGSKDDGSEGTGISLLLLKRASSCKWPVVQGRAFTATTKSFDDPSYVRNSVNAMKSCSGQASASASSSIDFNSSRQTDICVQRQGSASTSSSVDLSSSRQTEPRVQRQLSRRADLENSLSNPVAKLQNIEFSLSRTSSNACEALIHSKSTIDQKFDDSVRDMEYNGSEEPLVAEKQGGDLENTEPGDLHSSFIKIDILEEDKLDHVDSCRVMDASTSELSSHRRIRLLDISSAELDEDCISSRNAEDIPNNGRNISDLEVPFMNLDSSVVEEDAMLNSSVCGIEVSDAPMQGVLVMKLGELENGHDKTAGLETDFAASPNSNCIKESFQDTLVSSASLKDVLVSHMESNVSNIHEESTVTVEGARGHKLRSLTMEEATDTILFCSSIIHDLAYNAAETAIEREDSVLLQGSRPTVTILGKSSPNRKESRSRNFNKHTPKSRKAKQLRLETDENIPSAKIENDLKTQESLPYNLVVPTKAEGTKPPPKLESKCNCTVM